MNIASLSQVFPEFVHELVALVAAARPELVEQVEQLDVIDRCRCAQDDCAHFYTATRTEGAYGPGHSNVVLGSASGLIVLDLIGDKIVAVEILDRPDVKLRLDAFLPISDSAGS